MKRFSAALMVLSVCLCLIVLSACGNAPGTGGKGVEPDIPAVEDDVLPGETEESVEPESGEEGTAESIPEEDSPEILPPAEPPARGLLDRHDFVETDSLERSFDPATKTLTITGTGAMADVFEVDYDNGNDWHYELPEPLEYAGETEHLVVGEGVTSIGNYAFMEFRKLKSVVLPSTIDYIGSYAFYRCICLRELTMPHVRLVEQMAFCATDITASGKVPLVLPEGCEHIGHHAFSDIGISALESTTVTIPSSLIVIEEGGLETYSFSEYIVAEDNPMYTAVDGVLFSKNMSELVSFPNKTGLTEYTVPDGVVRLAPGSFLNVQNLTRLSFPASLTDMSEAFGGQYGMEYYEVAEENPAYRSQDGVLFSKDGKELIAFPLGRYFDEYAIPDGTEGMAENAMFYIQVRSLTYPASFRIPLVYGDGWTYADAVVVSFQTEEIHFSDGVTTIYDGELSGMEGLQRVYIPRSVTEITDNAFPGVLAGLEPDFYYNYETPIEIYYAGSREEWDRISVGGGNDALAAVEIHFAA